MATTTGNPILETLEQELTRIWTDILEAPSIGKDEDFFDLGGHSLLSIELRARLRRELNAPRLRVDVLETSTVATMAESILRQLAGAA